MSDPNPFQQAGDFAADAAVDTTADHPLNQGLDVVASHLTGGNLVEQRLKTAVDQVINNEGTGLLMGEAMKPTTRQELMD